MTHVFINCSYKKKNVIANSPVGKPGLTLRIKANSMGLTSLKKMLLKMPFNNDYGLHFIGPSEQNPRAPGNYP